MSTLKQQLLAKGIVENVKQGNPLTAAQLLENVGYSKSVAEAKPGEIIAQQGVQEELKRLGFSIDNAKRVVGKILNSDASEDKDRLKAAEIIFKVTGEFAPEKHLVVTKKIISVDE